MTRVAIDTRDLYIAKTGTRTVLEELINHFKPDPEVELIELRPEKFKSRHSKLSRIYEHIQYFIWKEISLPILVRKYNCNVLKSFNSFIAVSPPLCSYFGNPKVK